MKNRVYLSGPMADCTYEEKNDWRHYVIDASTIEEFEVIDPCRREWTKFGIKAIVELDKNDIQEANIVLCNPWKISPGTMMEILYAWENGKIVLTIGDPEKLSPWINYHSTYILPSIDAALKWIREHA